MKCQLAKDSIGGRYGWLNHWWGYTNSNIGAEPARSPPITKRALSEMVSTADGSERTNPGATTARTPYIGLVMTACWVMNQADSVQAGR